MRLQRSGFESACRIGAFAVLGWMLGTALIPVPDTHAVRAAAADVPKRLVEWTRTTADAPIHLDVAATPASWQTDWLAALRRGGRAVTWSGAPRALAVSIEPLADPSGGLRIGVAAPSGTNVVVRDDASVIDTVHVAGLGAAVTTPMSVGAVRVSSGDEAASVSIPRAPAIKPVVVIGAAGWEGKFIVSALEERGWPVDAHFTVAPKVDVTQGGATIVLDTSRVSAVIAVDSTIAPYGAALDRFVRAGGGLVLAGPASSTRAVAALAPGTLAPRTHPNVLANDTIRLGATGFYPVALGRDGVALERRDGGVAIAARRVGAGRVIQVGYDDSWRWRMAGAPGSEAAHREWWARIVASVAYAPALQPVAAEAPATSAASAASAPVAHLVDQLGPSRSVEGLPAHGPIDRRLLLALMMILLLAEWTSRRLRGKR